MWKLTIFRGMIDKLRNENNFLKDTIVLPIRFSNILDENQHKF